MKRTIVTAWFAFAVSLTASAQEAEKPDSNEIKSMNQTERILEEATQDASDSQLADVLARLEENPLDLNYASETELAQLPGITRPMISKIVAARELSRFEAVDQLLKVEGMSSDVYQKIRKFVTVGPSDISTGLLSGSFRNRTVSDLQDRTGYLDGTYLGSSLKSYQRLIVNYSEAGSQLKKNTRSIQAGFLMEKDPGERRLNDFQAGYVLVNAPDISSRVILGDFVVESAEGLVLWRSIGFSKSGEVISSIEKSGGGLRPYLSTDENLFLRGGAFEWNSEGALFSAFYSNKSVTASVGGDGAIMSFDADGYHRTSAEEAGRDNAKERLIGFATGFEIVKGLSFGAKAYRADFSHPLLIGVAEVPSGPSVSVGGMDFRYTDSHFTLFSEIASSWGGGWAKVAGLIYEPTSRFNLAVVVRDYPMDFSNIHAYGFREGAGMTQNETGVYVGAKLSAAKWLRLSLYYDQFRFPWRTATLRLPTSGNDFLSLVELDVSKKLELQMQYHNKSKPLSTSGDDIFGRLVGLVGQRYQANYRMTLNYYSSPRMSWRSRFEYVGVRYSFDKPAERGLLYLQDGRWKISDDFTLDARVAIFQTDSFESRVYEFENDLKGTFANPALYGKGIRSYVLAKFKATNFLEVSGKYGSLMKDGVKVLSSGANEIRGNTEHHFSFQIDWLF